MNTFNVLHTSYTGPIPVCDLNKKGFYFLGERGETYIEGRALNEQGMVMLLISVTNKIKDTTFKKKIVIVNLVTFFKKL